VILTLCVLPWLLGSETTVFDPASSSTGLMLLLVLIKVDRMGLGTHLGLSRFMLALAEVIHSNSHMRLLIMAVVESCVRCSSFRLGVLSSETRLIWPCRFEFACLEEVVRSTFTCYETHFPNPDMSLEHLYMGRRYD
jgi:hypothetical protein